MARGAARNGWRAGIAGAIHSIATRWRAEPATAGSIRQLHILVALVAPFLMIATIAFMAQQQNASAERRERERAVSLQRFMIDQAALLGLDNASWNNAYRAAVLSHDSVWMDENWGPDAFGTIDYHDVFLVDARGRTGYASILGERVTTSAAAMIGATLAPLLRTAAAPGRDGRHTVFAPYAGGVGIVSATRVRPVDNSLLRGDAPIRYLITVKRLDRPALEALEAPSGFRRLSVVPLSTEARAGVPFFGIAGQPIATLSWQSRLPGYASAQAVLPMALVVFALLAYAGLIGSRTAQRWAEQVLANEAAARRLAELDALTELPNRRSFVARLQTALGTNSTVTVLYLDLDGFKGVNDAFGHMAGDALLAAAAERIALIARNGGAAVARLGGDEFAMLVAGAQVRERAEALAADAVDAFAYPIEAGGRQIYLGASIGLAVAPPGIDATELIRHADVAMYAAKAAGKRCWRAYDEAMDRGRDTRQHIAIELREAVKTGGIDVCFQPIVDARSERIVAAEALARWTSPTLGPVDPALFVSVAEEVGLIPELTESVLRKAARAAARWDISVAINLSAAQGWDTQFVDRLMTVLGESGLPAERLELEITEGYMLREPQGTANVLRRLRAQGVQIALDDFGTGYASLGYLGRLPLDRLKITRDFLEDVADLSGKGAMAAAVVQLGAALGLPVTAEGVETRAQADALREAGCVRLQGWLYGKPTSAAQLTRRLREQELAATS